MQRKYIVWANIFLYFWIAITLAVAIIDLALGILFGLDYDRIMARSYVEPLLTVGAVDSPPFLLAAAQAGVGMLFTIVLRGYIIWIINVALAIYFFTQTLEISDYNRLTTKPLASANNGGASNRGFVDEPSSRAQQQHPIEAYGNK